MSLSPKYKRVLIKLSGEVFLQDQHFGIQREACLHIASLVKQVSEMGVQVAIVVGGGNIFRGVRAEEVGLKRSPADQIGMLATVINAICLQQILDGINKKSIVMSAFSCDSMVVDYKWDLAQSYLENDNIVILCGGTGHPYFTTDTAAALRALEVEADILLKATKVNGIYDKDPKRNHDAKRFGHISYSELLAQNLKIMDGSAVALCRDNKLPIHVFDVFSKNALMQVVAGESIGTLVSGE